ncbi:DUF3828 domain-containing protein [Reyranella sp.]|uniref:DUF3828 domain-containing protein n=1 Tax=Reyranella sp. TaxID=1929291 RepID=UPI003C7D2EBD
MNFEKPGRRLVLAGLVAALAVTDASAQAATAQAFVESLYRPYLTKGFQGQPYDDTARFFVPALAQAIDRDNREAKRRNEVPTLNGDPFVDAQDWEISKLTVDVTADGDAATARVSFQTFGEAKQVLLELAKTPAGWRIAEIKAPSGSLRALYKLK